MTGQMSNLQVFRHILGKRIPTNETLFTLSDVQEIHDLFGECLIDVKDFRAKLANMKETVVFDSSLIDYFD